MQSNYIITIKKSNRKSISIQCQQTNNQNELLIKAPVFVSKKIIEQFINEKSSWITKQFNHYDNNKHLTFPTTFKEGTTLYFLGKPYKLEHHIHSQKKIFFLVFWRKTVGWKWTFNTSRSLKRKFKRRH